jgi:hypothetical protein
MPSYKGYSPQDSGSSVSPRYKAHSSIDKDRPSPRDRQSPRPHSPHTAGRPIISPRNKDQPIGTISMGSPRRKIEPANLAPRLGVPNLSPRATPGKLRSQSVTIGPALPNGMLHKTSFLTLRSSI